MRQLPSNLSSKINQSLQTIGNNANPKMEVTVARAKSTVYDSTYWTVETIREIGGLGDVSVAPRRLKAYGRPDRIYEIHVRDGQVYTSIREYPDRLKEGFKPQFSLGPGTSVGLAFNGEWERYRKLYRLTTEDKPWITWVDTSKVLWAQRWDEIETRIQLSTDVVKVKMIRAWKNLVLQQQDQGIVVGYIKTDGKVYYRNYSMQEDYSEIWEYEKILLSFTESAININLFITNDYRMGFIIEDNMKNIHWFVTHRNWGGMASPAESLIVEVSDLQFDIIDITTYMVGTVDDIFDQGEAGAVHITSAKLEAEHLSTTTTPIRLYVCPPTISPEPDIINVDRLSFTDNKTIQLTFNYNLACDLARLKLGLDLRTTSGAVLEIDAVTQNDNILTITTVEEMRLIDNVTLTFTNIGGYFLAVRINETCVLDYGKPVNLNILGAPPEVQENLPVFIDVTFTVSEIITTETFEEENLVSDINNLTFTVIEVDTRHRMTDERIVSGISSINFIVTQTGTSPV